MSKTIRKNRKKRNSSEISVGDYVTGISHRTYGITNNKSICKVIQIRKNSPIDLKIKVISHTTYEEEIGKTFSVESKYFKKVSKNYML